MTKAPWLLAGIFAIAAAALVGILMPSLVIREGPWMACLHSAVLPDREVENPQPVEVLHQWFPPEVTCVYEAVDGGTAQKVVALSSTMQSTISVLIAASGLVLIGVEIGRRVGTRPSGAAD